MDMKRVRCLYRVSTKKQLDDNDIPTQKKACKEFIKAHPDWKLTKEYIEKGVSGYHRSAAQRDVVQELKRDVENNEFDVLVVFMFDRLGRREDETSFIVEWLVVNGVEVWSTKEGQQRFDNRVDKLMNYIRFWQSGGESEKTSVRVAEKHKQMVEEGVYRGGRVPFGYRLELSGRINRKGYETKKIVIDEVESKTVKEIFRLATQYGYGGKKIAGCLNEKGIKNKSGNVWTHVNVLDLLKNPIYKGVYVSGKRKSIRGSKIRTTSEQWITSNEVINDYQIVDEKTWNKAESIRNARKSGKKNYPGNTKGQLLFIGYTVCGSCGSKLRQKLVKKGWTRKSDAKEFSYYQAVYCCSQHKATKACSGQSTYSKNKIEPVILAEINIYLDNLERIDLSDKIEQLRNSAVYEKQLEIDRANASIIEQNNDIDILNKEILKCLSGKSSFSQNHLSKLLEQKEAEIEDNKSTLNTLYRELNEKQNEISNFTEYEAKAPEWRKEFENAPIELKKMLMGELIEEIIINRDSIEVKFKFDLLNLQQGGERLGEHESKENSMPISG